MRSRILSAARTARYAVSADWHRTIALRCPGWVIRVAPTANQPFPVYPDNRHVGDAPTLRDDKLRQTDSPDGQNLFNFSDDRFGHQAFSLPNRARKNEFRELVQSDLSLSARRADHDPPL